MCARKQNRSASKGTRKSEHLPGLRRDKTQTPTGDPLAVLCSDIHLSHLPPIARSQEPDWYGVMAKALAAIKTLGDFHTVPIICAGDLFDKWTSPPELINWAMAHVPFMHTIPGQHELPNHRLDEVHRSAYWTLVQAGVIDHIHEHDEDASPNLCVWPFHWGWDFASLDEADDDDRFNLAVLHHYVWMDKKHPKADDRDSAARVQKAFRGFDAVVIGDNHSGFLLPGNKSKGLPTVFNCGTLMRRKTDEADYTPQIGLLHTCGTVVPYFLNTSDDDVLNPQAAELENLMETLSVDMSEFVEQLNTMSDNALNFTEALANAARLRGLKGITKNILVELLELVTQQTK